MVAGRQRTTLSALSSGQTSLGLSAPPRQRLSTDTDRLTSPTGPGGAGALASGPDGR